MMRLPANRRREAITGLLFAAPWFIGFGIFMAYPVFASLYYSLCDYSVLKPAMFIGTENYTELFNDQVFWQAAGNTLYYAVLSVPIGLASALGLALLLNTKAKGMTIYRTIFFLPSLVPTIPMAVLWLWLLNGEHGILNYFLNFLGIHGPNWLGDPAWTKPSLMLLGIWGLGNTMLIFLASLQDVPQSLLEAADLDGATAARKLKVVVVPMISPVILFNAIMGMIGSLQVFAIPFVMFPNGTPQRSAYFYSSYLFDSAFKFNRMGYASAMGWIMFAVILVLTYGVLKFGEKKVHYEGS
jgi:multiple sugar transport system permease protein